MHTRTLEAGFRQWMESLNLDSPTDGLYTSIFMCLLIVDRCRQQVEVTAVKWMVGFTSSCVHIEMV